MAVEVKINGEQIAVVSELLSKFGSRETRLALHQAWSIEGVKWVDSNFRQQGALTGTPWAPLSKGTIAGRRKGKGAGAAQILRDTGELQKSFGQPVYDENQAVVGSPKFYAEFHEEGRKGPWAIKPRKPGGVLAFPGSDGKTVFARSVMHPGYPARRMLPRQTDQNFVDKLKAAATYLLNKLSNSR